MKTAEWKAKREVYNTVSTESLKSVINDYENKLCEMHSQILVLNSDKERLKEDKDNLNSEIKRIQDSADRYSRWWTQDQNKVRDEVKKTAKYKRYSKRIIELIRAKWWVRGKMLKFLLKEF
jgi:predicted  nucleic acid-binding Zn-ribbon protein